MVHAGLSVPQGARFAEVPVVTAPVIIVTPCSIETRRPASTEAPVLVVVATAVPPALSSTAS